MHNLRRFYYQNKRKIQAVIFFIVFFIIILQVINHMVAENNKAKENQLIQNNNTIENTTTNKNTSTSVTTDKSVVTGNTLNTTKIQTANEIIERFITYCNNKEIEKAYNLISDECKEENFKDVQSFKNLYYDTNFKGNTKKTATIENWFANTYAVYISDDMLSTGKVSDLKTRDYMTIVKQDGEYKLNIHSFISKESLKSEQTIDNITFKVISKNIYMDYEEYTVQVQNNSDNTILLDTQKSTKSIYLQDINSVKYYCYTNEIISEFLKVNKGGSTQLKLKFMRSFSSSAKDVSLVFSDIVLNYNNSLNGDLNKQSIRIPI